MKTRLIADIAERVIWTFVQGATSTLLLTGFLDIAAWKAAVVGGLAGVLAFIKGTAASKVGSPATAATLPASVEAVGGVTGAVTGTVTSETGEILGEVTGTVEGTVGDALSILDEIEDKAAKPRRRIKGES